jgi:RHS repeat-associated protein
MIRRALLLSFVAGLFTTAALAQSCMPGATWCSGAYSYDGMGNIRAIGNDVYIYDTAGRLVSGTADKQRNPQGTSRQDYSYDAFGNRILVSRAGGSVDCLGGCELPVTVDQNTTTNHITSNNAQYDAAGNLTYIQNVVGGTAYTATYTYDTAGRLARAAANTDIRDFLYTADDERIATANGASWTWTVRGLDGKVLREFTSMADSNTGLPTANRQWSKDYVWRDGLLLASVTPTTPGASSTQHFHLDHLGTPRLVTGDNGVQLGIHAYYPFGAELNLGLNEQPTELMKFTGHERDVLAGDPHTLDDMHARFYSGTAGRFLSVDPVIGKPAQPQSWNRYAYVQNNPINRTDPTGRCGESANFVGPTKPCMEVVKNVVDKAAFLFAKPGLTVMAGFYNDSPKQVASGTAQLIVAGAVGGAVSALTKPALAAASSTSLMSRSSIALNLGGEGEVAGASVVNVQAGSMGGNTAMAVRSAVGLARTTGQSVVVASGDALPFQTGAVNTVITNNVPINAGMTYFGQSFTSSEIYRVLSTVGQWIGSSVP